MNNMYENTLMIHKSYSNKKYTNDKQFKKTREMLKKLHLRRSTSRLININFIKYHQNIIKINIEFQKTTNLNVLKFCTMLKDLNFSKNNVTSLDFIYSLTELVNLNCSSNKIVTMNPVKCCTKLEMLNCDDNNFTSVNILKYLKKLKRFSCYNVHPLKKIKSIGNLGRNTNLKYLTLNVESIVRLPDLKKCSSLTHLYLGHSLQMSIQIFHDITHLKQLCYVHYSTRNDSEYINNLLRTKINQNIRIELGS